MANIAMNAAKSIMIAGGLSALLSLFPLTAIGNYFFGLWVWSGGMGAVYLYSRAQKKPLQLTQSLSLGLLAGLFGGLLFSGVVVSVVPHLDPQVYQQNIPGGFTTGLLMALVAVMTLLYAAIAMVGGLIGHFLFRDKDYLTSYNVNTNYVSSLKQSSTKKKSPKKKSKKKKTRKKK